MLENNRKAQIMAEMTPEGSVIITPMMQYLEMQRLAKAVDKLTENLDPALTDIRSKIDDHEDRIRGMERRIWAAMGASSAVSIFGMYVVTQLVSG